MVDHAGRLPTAECEIFVGSLGGAVNRVPADATAYPHRDVEFVVNVHTRWQDRSLDETYVAWARELVFMPDDEADRSRAGAYGPCYARLSVIKKTYDPGNLFCLNQNITPAA